MNTLKTINPNILFDNFSKDKYGHKYCIAQCPYCYNLFKVRTDSLNSGNTNSCGCLRYRKKRNTYYFPLGCEFVVGYFDNTDRIFIFDCDKYDILSLHHWTDKNTKSRHEPITTINGKTTSMARLLLDTPARLDSEHINLNPLDNRMCNLRTATRAENIQNRRNSKQDNPNYGEFTLKNSQAIAKKIETHQFSELLCLGDTLEQINTLPEKNVCKTILRSMCRNTINGLLSEDIATLLLQLITDYKSNQHLA